MKNVSAIYVSILLAFLFLLETNEVRAQSDAQNLSQLAAQANQRLPHQIGSVEIRSIRTFCSFGCQEVWTSGVLRLIGWTPRLAKQNIDIPRLGQDLRTEILQDYCTIPASKNNISFQVYLTDMFGADLGNVAFVQPSDCPANATPNVVQNSTPQFAPADARFLNDWAAEIRKDLPQQVGSIVFRNVYSLCPFGCQSAYGSLRRIELGGWTPQFKKNEVDMAQLGPSIKSLILDKYCDKARNSNINFLVTLVDKNQDYIGQLAHLTPADCPAKVTQNIPQITSNPTPSSANSSVEQQLWDAVKNSSRLQDFQTYLNNYPNGQYSSIARLKIGQLGGAAQSSPAIPSQASATGNVEEQYWDTVKNSTRIQDFESYLKDYPNGQFVPIARLRISQLGSSASATPQVNLTAEDQYWNAVSGSQRSQDFQDYLNNYPNGKFAAIARVKISQLGGIPPQSTTSNNAVEDQFWNSVSNSQRAQDFQSYLNSYPNGQYSSIARLRIDQINRTNLSPSTSPQMTGQQILARAQFGSIKEIAALKNFWVLTDGNDLDSRRMITEELVKAFPKLSVAARQEDAEFYILFAMTDSSGAIVANNSNRSDQTYSGQLLVFTSTSSGGGSPDIRILFKSTKTQYFSQMGISFSSHPAKSTVKDFVKALEKINF